MISSVGTCHDASSHDLSIAMKGSCLTKATFVESECIKKKDRDINADFARCEVPNNGLFLRVLINLVGLEEVIDKIDLACSNSKDILKLDGRGV